MLQVRKLVLAVAAATAMASGAAHALGLGEITVKSALDQPLVAEVELLETKGLTVDEIRSRLASVEEFGQAGVDRPYFLTSLQFTPVLQGGRSYVRITSTQPVREPFINFLMEVYWPNGKLLKEYTLLLDPPMYTPQQVIYSAAPATVARQATPPARPQARQTRARQPATQAQSAKEGEYRVRKNDTLWEIALRTGGRGQSVHQTMLAIQDLNPDAFIGGNINRLKSNQVLRLPTAEQIKQRSVKQAVSEVQAQEQAWRNQRRPQRQLDARERSTADPAPVKAEQQDNLRLVAAETGEASVGSDRGAVDKLQDQLAQAKELLDSAVRENQELNSRLADLSSQAEKLQRLLELKNEQLANLQNLEAQQDAAEPVVADPPTEAEQPATADQATGVEDPAADGFSIAPAEVADELAQAAELSVDEQIAEELRAQELQAAEQAKEQEAAQEQQLNTAPEPEKDSFAFLDELLQNPMFLPAAGAGAAGLLLLLLLLRRKSRTQPEADPAAPLAASDVLTDTQQEPLVEGLDDDLLSTDLDIDSATDFSGTTSQDALTEAEDHINFGRFSQAAQVLLNAIDQEPQREDLRIKLLEVYADLEDQHSFVDQFEELVAMGTAEDKLNSLRQRYPHFLTAAPLAGDLADLPDIEGLPGLEDQPDDSLQDEDFPDLDELFGQSSTEESEPLESLEADLDAAFQQLAETPQVPEIPEVPEVPEIPEIAPAISELSLPEPEPEDFAAALDFDLSDISPAEESAAATADTEDELSLDDLEFDLSLPMEESQLSPEVETEVEPAAVEEESVPSPEPRAFAVELQNELDTAMADSPAGTADQEAADFAGLDLDLDLDSLLGLTDEAAPEQQAADNTSEESLGFELDDLLGDQDAATDEVQAALEDLDFGQPDKQPAAPAEDTSFASLADDLGEDLDFLSGTDEATTKLDLALALTEMGDMEGARDILEEVAREGNTEQQEQARDMLAKLS